MSELAAEVSKIIAEVLMISTDEITPESGVGKHDKWDSLGHLNVMVKLGETYNFEVDAELMTALQTFEEILDHIGKL